MPKESEKAQTSASMASSSSSFFPDVWTWIQNLPAITQWRKDSMSICICCLSSSQPSLKLSISKNPQSSSLSFSILADYNLPISLWTSKPFKLNSKFTNSIDEETISNLFGNFIEDVLNYCPNRTTSFLRIPQIDSSNNFKDIFNVSFLTLTFLICIYEAPVDLRLESLNGLKNQLACPRSRETTKLLARLVGSSLEEQWMRSVNLAITNWIVELQAMLNHSIKTPSPLFSYGVSNVGLWKVQLYCPVIAMDVEKSTNPPPDERLWFSLNYHQLEGVIQLNYKVIVREKWVDVMVNVYNVRVRHYPTCNRDSHDRAMSRNIRKTLPLTNLSTAHSPNQRSDRISNQVLRQPNKGNRPRKNPRRLVQSTKLTGTQQSVYGDTANLNWFLHDSVDGREVFSSKPSKMALIQPKAWFKNRYSSVYRPFTRQGGVVFANDEYGETVGWKVERSELGKVMEWEMRGWIWLTYWPNKHRSFYSETRRLEFREILQLTLS
ncbi:unnamed protein product [Camellia sinensis]